MVYILLLLMMVKYIAVAWGSSWSFTKTLCRAQLDITITLALFVFAVTIYEYMLNYPAPWKPETFILLLSIVVIEFVVLKGHVLLWAMSFRYFYGNEKHSPDKDIRLSRTLHWVVVMWYISVGGLVAVLL